MSGYSEEETTDHSLTIDGFSY